MKKILILGATGNLGQCLTPQAVELGHQVSVIVRNPDKLDKGVRASCKVIYGDLMQMTALDLSAHFEANDAIINVAGNVGDEANSVSLVSRLAEASELLPKPNERVFWFMAGAGVLDLPGDLRQLVDIPNVPQKYLVHRENLARLSGSGLDFRLCCPGPMVDAPAVGLERMRISTDRFPVRLPGWTAFAPGFLTIPFLPKALGEVTVPYADVAALILENLTPGGDLSRKRVGIALPIGMTMKNICESAWCRVNHLERQPVQGSGRKTASLPVTDMQEFLRSSTAEKQFDDASKQTISSFVLFGLLRKPLPIIRVSG